MWFSLYETPRNCCWCSLFNFVRVFFKAKLIKRIEQSNFIWEFCGQKKRKEKSIVRKLCLISTFPLFFSLSFHVNHSRFAMRFVGTQPLNTHVINVSHGNTFPIITTEKETLLLFANIPKRDRETEKEMFIHYLLQAFACILKVVQRLLLYGNSTVSWILPETRNKYKDMEKMECVFHLFIFFFSQVLTVSE